MKEGWHQDDYIVLFDADSAQAVSARYGVARWLPTYTLIGLLNWDDLLVQDQAGAAFTVPSLPMSREYLSPFKLPRGDVVLAADARLTGKIRWYVKPLVFGGNPADESNVCWVTPEQHAQLVVFWNERYEEAKAIVPQQ